MNVLKKIDKFFFFIAKLSIFICMFVITFNSIGRYIFNKPIVGSYEFIEAFLMVSLVFMGLGTTWLMKGLISVDIISQKFSIIMKNILYFIILIASISFFLLIGYKGLITTINAVVHSEISTGLIHWPMSMSYIWIPLGCLMIVSIMLYEFIAGVLKLFRKGINSEIFELLDY